MKRDELKIGEIYHAKDTSTEYIIRFCESDIPFVEIVGTGRFDTCGGFRRSDYVFTEATPKQIKHFEACERARRYVDVPKEEVVNDYSLY